MVSIRRHSRWKGPLGPAEDPPLHLHPVEVEALGGDEPVCFLRDIELNQPPPLPRGRGRGRPRGRGRGRTRGGGGGGQLHGHYQRGRGRGRKRRQVPRGLVLRSDLPADAKSVVLALAAAEPNGGDKIAALAAYSGTNKTKKKTISYLHKEDSQDTCVYLREGGFHEIVPFAIPVGVMTDVICEEVTLLDLGGGNTTNEIGELPHKDQINRIAEQTDISQERNGKVANIEARGNNRSSEHTTSRGKRKSINDLIENNPKRALAMKLDNTWAREAAAHREMLEKISSGIKSCVEAFKMGLGDVFVVPSFDPPPDKYDGAPSIILRATDITDSSEQDFFTYVQQDIKALQGLANAETVDMTALSSQINKILAHWTKLFSSHISGGLAEMMQALNELKSLIASDAVSPLPFDAAGVTAHKIRVEDALKEAAVLQQAIPGALKEIGQVEAAAHMKCNELATLKEKQKKKIARLKASLALAEKSLKDTENQETEFKQLLKESEAARQDSSKYFDDLNKTTESGKLAKTEVEKCMQYMGVGSKSTQPKPVSSLISYMLSSSCEG